MAALPGLAVVDRRGDDLHPIFPGPWYVYIPDHCHTRVQPIHQDAGRFESGKAERLVILNRRRQNAPAGGRENDHLLAVLYPLLDDRARINVESPSQIEGNHRDRRGRFFGRQVQESSSRS